MRIHLDYCSHSRMSRIRGMIEREGMMGRVEDVAHVYMKGGKRDLDCEKLREA